MFDKIIIILLLFLPFYSISQVESGRIASLKIKTTTFCDHCKVCETCAGKMETDLYYVKGIKLVEYSENNMTILVKYKKDKITPDKIRLAISKLGYAADDVPADISAYEKLDSCCKKK
jgi:periplasmic mercuric ion binding protein